MNRPAPLWLWIVATIAGALAAVVGAIAGNPASVVLGLMWMAVGIYRVLKVRREVEPNG